MSPERTQFKQVTFLFGILFLSFVLRLYRLDAQSLWADEGTSVALAGRDWAAITQGAALDIHPPFYYYTLHVWQGLFGTNEFAGRALSVFYGTALVGVTYLLGRRLFGPTTGLVAAFIAALSPFQVYYSQETRMYILVSLLSALSFYFCLRLRGPLRRVEPSLDCSMAIRFQPEGRGRLQLGLAWDLGFYIAFTTLALYTQYFAFAILLAENLAFAIWLITNRHSQPAIRNSPLAIRNSQFAPRHLAPRPTRDFRPLHSLVGCAVLPVRRLAGDQRTVWPRFLADRDAARVQPGVVGGARDGLDDVGVCGVGGVGDSDGSQRV